jgi:hypothetical protein
VQDSEWGSKAEMIMFTERFRTNVVVLIQSSAGVSVFGTINYMERELAYKKRRKKSSPTTSIDWKETVFVWFHVHEDPLRLISDPINEPNHYVILEPWEEKHFVQGKITYIFKEKNKENTDQVQMVDLPKFVKIPGKSLREVVTIPSNIENLCFIVHRVPSDGNCLYHALLGNNLFTDRNPGLKNNILKLRKTLSECIRCQQNKDFVEHLLKNHQPPNVNSIAEWAGQVEEDTAWGSNSVATMFTHLFGLNVVVVLQLVNGISAFGTYTTHKKHLVCDKSKVTEEDYKERVNYKNTMFVWHHKLENPTELVVDHRDANHFSLLELCPDDMVMRDEEVFVLQDFWRDSSKTPTRSPIELMDSPLPCAPKSNGVWMLKTSRTHSG